MTTTTTTTTQDSLEHVEPVPQTQPVLFHYEGYHLSKGLCYRLLSEQTM